MFKLSVGCAVVFEILHAPARAACTTNTPASNTAVTCTGAGVTAVTAQPGSTGVTITIDPTVNATLPRTPSPVLFRVDASSSITNGGNITLTGGGGMGGNRGAVMLGENTGNQLLNDTSGLITTTGAYNDGMAADGGGNTLTNAGTISTAGPNAYGMTAAWGQTNVGQTNNTLINTGTISTAGSNARAISIVGGSGTIRNDGTISTSGAASPTAYMQGNNGALINTGTIRATGADSDAVFSNTAGSSFVATIENRAGGVIFSQNAAAVRTLNGASTVINAGRLESGVGRAVSMGTGANTLILQTGSEIIGSADGGAGNSVSSVVLQGNGVASNAFTQFENLRMEGGTWTFSGTGTFNNVLVQNGLLDLTGSFAPNTVATIDAPATLQATAQNLPGTVIDNGTLRFNQAIAGTYAGTISGSGLVQKTGAGTLTLAPAVSGGNTYSGGTFVNQGVLAVGADNALGAPTGALTLNTGTLQFASAFNLAASRALTLGAGGGTLNTLTNNTTITQGIGGTGALTKLGTGRLTLNGTSTYTGATNLNAGTLVVGDATHAGASTGTATAPVIVASSAVLGGYGSVTGNVTNNGTITVANATPGLTASSTGTFTVNGRLQNNDLVQVAGAGVGNRLIVAGDYVGENGRIALNTQVGADNSPTDKVVIRGGQASGSTTLAVTNLGGTGAATTGNGIELVQAAGGATTTGGAFSLAAPVNAGAYTYYLARGGVTDGSAQGWYLRNNVAALPVPPAPGTPPSPGTPTEPPTPAPGSPALPAAPAAGSDPIALYRPEVALYSAIPGVARQIGINQLDNFHDRQGDQRLLKGDGKFPASWGRAWGSKSIVSQNSAIDPKFDGSIFGAQAGQDIYADQSASGHRNHYGVFLGYARATGQVDGFSGGFYGTDVGHLAINAYSLGAYWTHVAPSGWYTDTVLMGSSLTIDPKSNLGGADSTHGKSIAASVETGLPIPLNDTFTLEPQAQLSWQRLSIKDIDDGAARVSFNRGNTYVGRVGVRLFADIDRAGVAWQPYVRLNVLRAFGSKDRTDFENSATFTSSVGQTAGQVSAGVVARLTRSSSVYVSASYMDNLGGAQQRSIGGNAGVRWSW